MRYKLLGRSGLRVSEVCLGTMTFGEDWSWGADKDVSRQIYEAFREAGGNFVDTANLYTNGTSERFVGEFVREERGAIVLATKYTNAFGGARPDPNAAGNQRKSMMQACEASLKRLGTDYIDLYWMHVWDTVTPVEEVMRAFDDLVRAGKVLYAGVSDAPAWYVAQANTLAEWRGWTAFVALQIEYSLIERTVERELLPMARALGLGVTPWSPLAGGILTGKYAGGGGAGGRLADPSMQAFAMMDERAKAIVAEVVAVGRELGRSPAQVALAWVRQQGTIPILGARKLEQFKDNLASLELTLPAEALARLEKVSWVPLGFPHDFIGKEMVRRVSHAGMRELLDA